MAQSQATPIEIEESKDQEKAQSSDFIKVAADKSLFIYVEKAREFLKNQDTVELSGLGNGE